MLDGRSSIIDLVYSLSLSSYFTQGDAQQRLTHLLIMSPSAKEICSKYSAGSVWLIDATYKTSRYGLPLLYIFGVSATSCTFTFAQCFMQNENVVDYLWALLHLREVFRNYHIQAEINFVTEKEIALMNALTQTFSNASCLLCRWHISKNIFAKQRKAFSTLDAWEEFVQAWNGLVAATTIVGYESKLASMHVAFPVVSIRYLDYTWLVYKEKFVSVFL